MMIYSHKLSSAAYAVEWLGQGTIFVAKRNILLPNIPLARVNGVSLGGKML